jgi:integrase
MLTGARREEIAALRWSEINLDEGLITLLPRRTKGRREHEIPLSVSALALLKAQPRTEDRDFVFGRGIGGFSGWSRCKERLDARVAAARLVAAKKGKPTSMPEWHLHDFRRSLSTTMHERLGVQPHVVEAVLGHATFKQGVAAVYNRSSYRGEKLRALELWGEHVIAIVEGRKSKVVSLRGA